MEYWCVEKEAVDYMRIRGQVEYNLYDRMKYIYDAGQDDKTMFVTNGMVPTEPFDQWLETAS